MPTRTAGVHVDFALERTRSPEPCPYFDIPLQLRVGICLHLTPKMLSDRGSVLRDIVGSQWALSTPQIRPALFELRQLQCMQPLRLVGISRAQTEAFLALPDQVAEIIRNTFPEPVVAAVGMLPGTSHRKSHVYHPCVPIRAAKAYDNQWPVDFIRLLCVLAEREGFPFRSQYSSSLISDLVWRPAHPRAPSRAAIIAAACANFSNAPLTTIPQTQIL